MPDASGISEPITVVLNVTGEAINLADDGVTPLPPQSSGGSENQPVVVTLNTSCRMIDVTPGPDAGR